MVEMAKTKVMCDCKCSHEEPAAKGTEFWNHPRCMDCLRRESNYHDPLHGNPS